MWLFLMSPLPLTDFEVQWYQNESRFTFVYSRDNLSKVKDRVYKTNLHVNVMILELIGLLFMLKIILQYILIVLVFFIFQKRLKNQS